MKNIPSDTGTSSLHQIDRTRSSYLDGVSSVPGSSPSPTPRRARRPCPSPAASAPSQAPRPRPRRVMPADPAPRRWRQLRPRLLALSHAASCPPPLPLAGARAWSLTARPEHTKLGRSGWRAAVGEAPSQAEHRRREERSSGGSAGHRG
jgi:hypothetical protein